MLCVLQTFKKSNKVEFESDTVKMKVKEMIQDFSQVPMVSGRAKDLKHIDDVSLSFDEQAQVYQVSVSVSSQAVMKTQSTFNIGIGELDSLTTITSTVQEDVEIVLTFKPSGKFQSFFNALHYFRIQAKAYISFGQIAANVSLNIYPFAFLYINSSHKLDFI